MSARPASAEDRRTTADDDDAPIAAKELIVAVRGDLDWIVMKCLEQAGVHFIQAMALARLGRGGEAQNTFDTGRRLLGTAADYTAGNFEGYWVVWTIAEVLEDEASGVLRHHATAALPAPP